MKITEETLKKMNVSLNDGKTYFFYDLNQVTENIFQIRKLFGGMNRIYFSVKANPNPTLLRHLNDLDVSFDVSSKHELETALACVTKENHITVSGPAKTDGFIGKIKNVGLGAVHLDSIEEYNILKSTAVPITVRWPLEVSYSQKVGIPTEDLQSIVKECANSGRLAGIHIYVGRERAEREVVDKQLSQIKNFVLNNQTAFKNRPSLFWGGGLPLLNHVTADHFPKDPFFEINLECGRAIVHNCGVYLTQILEIKEKNQEKLIILNGGLQHLAAYFGSPRFGQQDVTVNFLNSFGNETEIVNIYGSLGVSTDIMVKQVAVPKGIQRGDWIVIGPAGGYGFTAGTNQFLGTNNVQEIFLQKGKVQSTNVHPVGYLESGIYEYKNS